MAAAARLHVSRYVSRSSHSSRPSLTRSLALSLAIATASASLLAAGSSSARAAVEDEGVQSAPQVENAKFQLIGEINTNQISVHSGPSNNFYPTTKLKKGETVTVVGKKGEWLKILPPEGSFSYVPQVYVTRRGEGKVGRVNSPLNVRAGSTLNGMKTTVQTKLDPDQDVTILGEDDEYFKITPPEGAYLYVNAQYVTPTKVQGPTSTLAKAGTDTTKGAPEVSAEPGTPTTPAGEPKDGSAAPSEDLVVSKTPDKSTKIVANGTTQPGSDDASGQAEGPASRPSVASVTEEFQKAEADYQAAGKQNILDQPVDKLLERYTSLQKTGGLTGMNKRIVDARVTALKMRADAKAQMVAFRKSQDDKAQRDQALKAEQTEIGERMKQTQVALYTAVGTLRVSSLQQGQTTLYRLTDPGTGRTVVYIKSNDPKFAGMLNQFIGVRGDLVTDDNLKMKTITPTEAEQVEQTKVNRTVIATITPPSLLPAAASVDQSETGGN
jgi:uncharacterized protein YgiM (DUF1202 family)